MGLFEGAAAAGSVEARYELAVRGRLIFNKLSSQKVNHKIGPNRRRRGARGAGGVRAIGFNQLNHKGKS